MTERPSIIDLSQLKNTEPLVANFTPLDMSLPDKEPPEMKRDVVKILFEITQSVTNGRFNLETLKKAQRVLDLGMGRGAVGSAIRDLNVNPDFYLAGVDLVEYPNNNLYNAYNQRIKGDLTNKNLWTYIQDHEKPFDVIIGMGLPGPVMKGLTESDVLEKIMTPQALCTFMSDQGFNLTSILSKYDRFAGKNISNDLILIHK